MEMAKRDLLLFHIYKSKGDRTIPVQSLLLIPGKEVDVVVCSLGFANNNIICLAWNCFVNNLIQFYLCGIPPAPLYSIPSVRPSVHKLPGCLPSPFHHIWWLGAVRVHGTRNAGPSGMMRMRMTTPTTTDMDEWRMMEVIMLWRWWVDDGHGWRAWERQKLARNAEHGIAWKAISVNEIWISIFTNTDVLSPPSATYNCGVVSLLSCGEWNCFVYLDTVPCHV